MSAKEYKGLGRWLLRILAWVFLSYAVLVGFFVVVFRFRGKSAKDGVRAFNKQILNPAMMKLAGRRYWYAALIRHKGRRSEREYTTPVVAEPIEDGFIIPLPYGEEVDWLRNVLEAGEASIEAKGETYTVMEPEVVDVEAAFPLLPPRLRSTLRLFGIERFLKVKRLPEGATTEEHRPVGVAKIENLSL